ncbi:MAG: hypothetical protein QXG00_05760 [Candidatus Woesearchaeota archaeon]
MDNFLEFFKKIKDHTTIIAIIVGIFITIFNWYSNIDKKFEDLEKEVSKLKIEYRNMYRNSLIRNKIRIEREIKDLTERERQLTPIEREKLTELIIEREKIILEINQLINLDK